MTDRRLSRAALKALLTPPHPDVRLARAALKTLYTPPHPNVRLARSALKVLTTTSVIGGTITETPDAFTATSTLRMASDGVRDPVAVFAATGDLPDPLETLLDRADLLTANVEMPMAGDDVVGDNLDTPEPWIVTATMWQPAERYADGGQLLTGVVTLLHPTDKRTDHLLAPNVLTAHGALVQPTQTAWYPPPANDDWADAELISDTDVIVYGSALGGTAETGEIGKGYDSDLIGAYTEAGGTVWYKFVPAFSGAMEVYASGIEAEFYGYLGLWGPGLSGAPTWTAEAADEGQHPDYLWDDDGGSMYAYAEVTGGQTYYLSMFALGDNPPAESTDFQLEIELSPVDSINMPTEKFTDRPPKYVTNIRIRHPQSRLRNPDPEDPEEPEDPDDPGGGGGLTTYRWVLWDPETGDEWEMPINPDTMTSPHLGRSIRTINGNFRGDPSRVRTVVGPQQPRQWEWSGVIRTQAHYNQLLAWSRVENMIWVTDHLGRTYEVMIDSFEPVDRKPTVQTPWRLRYTMKALIMTVRGDHNAGELP